MTMTNYYRRSMLSRSNKPMVMLLCVFILTMIELLWGYYGVRVLFVFPTKQFYKEKEEEPLLVQPHQQLGFDVDKNSTISNDSSGSGWWKTTIENPDTLIEDIDLQAINTTTSCGLYKCYFASKSQPNYGYLIGQRKFYKDYTKNFNLFNLKRTYDLAIILEKEYGIRHFLKSPPIPMNCTSKLAKVLNIGTKRSGRPPFIETKPNHYKRDRLIIQIVQQAPQPNLVLYGIRKNKDTNLNTVFHYPNAHEFFYYISNKDDNKNNNNATTSPEVVSIFSTNNDYPYNNQQFRQNLIDDWNNTCEMLRVYPQFYSDWQIMLDRYGHIWHIDLDRAFINSFNDPKAPTDYTYRHNKIQNYIINPLLQASNNNLTT